MRLFVLAILIAGEHSIVHSQPTDSMEAIRFERFFREVALFRPSPGPAKLNGGDVNLLQRTPKEIFLLTNQENARLASVAADCDTQIRRFDQAVARSVFSARLELLQAENELPANNELDEISREREGIVLMHIQELRSAFGDQRFRVVEGYVHSRKDGDSFFPAFVLDNVKRPAEKPAGIRRKGDEDSPAAQDAQ
jgi:hypothetical protein